MWKKYFGLLAVCMMCCTLSSCGTTRPVHSFEGIPDEFTLCLEKALDALKESGEASIPYSYFPNDQLREARANATANLISYTIDSAEKINENLCAYEVSIEVKENPGDFETYNKFVGNIDGSILYIGNADWVPDSISENYVRENYVDPTSENDLGPYAIIFD